MSGVSDTKAKIRPTVKVLIERHSKSVSNSLNSLEVFLIMRYHLRVVFLCIYASPFNINHVGTLVWIVRWPRTTQTRFSKSAIAFLKYVFHVFH